MGYYVRFLPEKKSLPNWKLQFVSYRKMHVTNALAKKPKKECDISPARSRALGFIPAMTLDEARARQRQLNCELRLLHLSQRRFELEIREKHQRLVNDATLPELFLAEFEQRFLNRRGSENDRRPLAACWSTAKRVILQLRLNPSEWFDSAHLFYDLFCEKARSLSYIRKVLRLINRWGFFISRKTGKAFLPVPSPRGYERSRLAEIYYKKITHSRRKSDPITCAQLEIAKTKMHRRHYNWIFISVWAGLRPSEIDRLKDLENFMVKRTPHRPAVLWVYQEKLVALPPWERWKLIPLISQEQKRILKILRNGDFSRPCVKTIKRYFGNAVGLYGGRKGFTDLMLNRGHRLEEVSAWMGHTSIERTWRNYRNRLEARYIP